MSLWYSRLNAPGRQGTPSFVPWLQPFAWCSTPTEYLVNICYVNEWTDFVVQGSGLLYTARDDSRQVPWDLVTCSFVHLCCVLNHYPCCVSVFPAKSTTIKLAALPCASKGIRAAKEWAVHKDVGGPLMGIQDSAVTCAPFSSPLSILFTWDHQSKYQK